MILLASRTKQKPDRSVDAEKKLANNVRTSVFLVLLLCVTGLPAVSQGGKQTIVFTNLKNKKGKILIAVYNKPGDFAKKNKSYTAKSITVNGENTAAVVFENLPAGVYAIAAFLDENENGKLDTNFLGIPNEQYGFSNNARPLMRAATFNEAAFTVTQQDNNLEIKLK